VKELKNLGISVSDGWSGMRTWRGKIAKQVDETTDLLLPGGEVQHFIDFTDPHNKPVGEYVAKFVQEKLTGWTDLKLSDEIHAVVEPLGQHERSAKIRQEGYLRRGAADAGKHYETEEEQ